MIEGMDACSLADTMRQINVLNRYNHAPKAKKLSSHVCLVHLLLIYEVLNIGPRSLQLGPDVRTESGAHSSPCCADLRPSH